MYVCLIILIENRRFFIFKILFRQVLWGDAVERMRFKETMAIKLSESM